MNIKYKVSMKPENNTFALINQYFDIKDLDWCSYIEQYCLGIKTFVLKEDLSKMNICRKELEM